MQINNFLNKKISYKNVLQSTIYFDKKFQNSKKDFDITENFKTFLYSNENLQKYTSDFYIQKKNLKFKILNFLKLKFLMA